MMAAGLAAVVKRGSVKKGDKSMVDALAPAVAALETAAAEHRAAGEALNLAARAAAEGAEATRTLIARVGRARYQGDRAVGHVDAGAASVALLFETLAQEAQERGEGSQRA
jgi:dihydroxyacetone kinase-like protein